MNLTFKNPFSMHNRYEAKIISPNGEIKQEAIAYNIASSRIYVYGEQSQASDTFCLSNLYIGDGDFSTDSDISYYMKGKYQTFSFRNDCSSKWSRTPITNENNFQTIQLSATITIKAGIATGNYTEVGIGASNATLISHALFVDAEGNNIILNKTDYDILIITSIININVSLIDLTKTYNFRYFPAYENCMNGCYSVEHNTSYGNWLPSFSNMKFCFSNYYVPEIDSNNNLLYQEGMSLRDDYGSYEIRNYCSHTTFSPTSSYRELRAYSYGPVFQEPCTFKLLSKQVFADNINVGFAHSLIILNYGALPFPNHNILPPYEVKNIAIGTGNGENAYFYTSVNEVMLEENTPKITVYKNGEIVPASEYTFINFDLKKSPFWNKVLYRINNSDETDKEFVGKNKTFSPRGYSSSSAPYTNWAGNCNYTRALPMSNMSTYGISKDDNGIRELPNSKYSLVYGDSEQKISCDHIKLGTHSNVSSYSNIIYTLYYRDSEEDEWKKACEAKMAEKDFTYVSFNRISAHYWKIACNTDPLRTFGGDAFIGNKELIGAKDLQPSNDWLVVGDSQVLDYRKVGLTFNTPPANGDVITMDATLDLPYKTPSSAMSFSFQADVNFNDGGA